MFKVIIDRRTNRNADTGRFELIYKALAVTVPNYIGIDLKIDGHSYKKPIEYGLAIFAYYECFKCHKPYLFFYNKFFT